MKKNDAQFFTEDPDIVAPHAASLVESLRAFGYDLATALADLIDNCLFHHCHNIQVHFHWAGETSAIAIADDGDGMDESTLINAMRVGSRNPRDVRDPADFGRFGMGLKTASFSQCRRVTVFTRRKDGEALIRCWDLDLIAEINEWRLLRTASPLSIQLAEKAGALEHGTVVVWEKLDRLTAGNTTENDAEEDSFLKRAEQVKDHFATVFHRLMTGHNSVNFFLNGNRISPWDPFLINEPATQRRPPEKLPFQGHIIEVETFILPHSSKLDTEIRRRAAGIHGWNAHQGFYVYRNRRLLVPGDWLGIKGWQEDEYYNLARIRVDLPNALDLEWEIDVTKSRARPPDKLRRELIRIGEIARNDAKRVYLHRGAKLLPSHGKERIFLWEQTVNHGEVFYRINRDHPLVKQVRETSTDMPKFSALLRFIEETIPIPLITITEREKPDQTIGSFEASKESEILEVMRQVFTSLLTGGLSRKDALLRLAHFEPFPRFPHLLQTLQEEDEK